MNRPPMILVQTVAFAAAAGSFVIQVLGIAVHRGVSLPPVVVIPIVAVTAVRAAILFDRTLAPARDRLRQEATPGNDSPKLMAVEMAIATVWMLGWITPAHLLDTGGGIATWRMVPYLMAGATGPLIFQFGKMRRKPA